MLARAHTRGPPENRTGSCPGPPIGREHPATGFSVFLVHVIVVLSFSETVEMAGGLGTPAGIWVPQAARALSTSDFFTMEIIVMLIEPGETAYHCCS
jgi:hypothetical protein